MSIKTQFNLSRCVRLHRHHRRHGLDFYLELGIFLRSITPTHEIVTHGLMEWLLGGDC